MEKVVIRIVRNNSMACNQLVWFGWKNNQTEVISIEEKTNKIVA